MKNLVILSFLLFSHSTQASLLSALNPFQGEANLKLGTFFEYPSFSFLLSVDEGRSDLAANEKRLQFLPSQDPDIGFEVEAYGLGFYYRTKLRSGSKLFDPPGTLNSEMHDFRLRREINNLGFEVQYQKIKGFYVDLNATSGLTISNGEDTVITNDGSGSNLEAEILNRPDIESRNFDLSFFHQAHLFGDRENGRLTKSETLPFNLWFPYEVGYRYLAVQADFPMIQNDQASNFREVANLEGVTQHGLRAMLGFGMGYAGEKFQPQMHMKIGWEALYQTLEMSTIDDGELSSGLPVELEFILPYMGEHNHWELFFQLDIFTGKMKSANFDSTKSILGLKYAYHF